MTMDDIFHALADRNRRLLLDRLRDNNGQTLSQLCEGQPITRQAVSKHLAVLERADLVLTKRRGREKLHYINPVPVHQIACRWLNQFETMPLADLVRGYNEAAG
ncbi:helix-turn-helix domain-containing protein [Kordiimonas sp. A6E486]|nr:helix-turn-helix domain-containing protein [Kordiimonas marina]MCJ9427516.1 helix-turn-helix domain-containing protein [Kordiimonas marina]